MQSLNNDPLHPLAEHNPFSYGYGYSQSSQRRATSTTPLPVQPDQSPSSTSGLAKAMTSTHPSPVPSSRKRFSAPLPFTRLVGGGSSPAVPVVDLGTAGRERVLARAWDKGVDDNAAAGDARRRVLWARWDYLRDRRLLFIAYSTAFEVWDCTDLESLQEVLHIRTGRNVASSNPDSDWSGRVLHAAAVPESRTEGANDPFKGDRPLIGILTDQGNDPGLLFLYSLSRHEVVRRATVSEGAVEFEANEEFIVVSTVDPPGLSILSSTTLDTLHVIQGPSLLPYLAPSPSISSDTNGGIEAFSNAVTGSFNHIYQQASQQHQQQQPIS